MANAVVTISAWGVPSQIRETVIGRVAVVMAAQHSRRARLPKRLEHKYVNEQVSILTFAISKAYGEVAGLTSLRGR